MSDAIISIKPKHVENILAGRKTVELRTRSISLVQGSRLWIYSTLPVGKIQLSVEIDFIDALPPKQAWKKYEKEICISKNDFEEYTAGRSLVSLIGLINIQPLDNAVCLRTLRSYEKNFHPPQFFSKIHPGRELWSALCAPA